MSVYEIITTRILNELKKGIIPWARGWKPEYHLPTNWFTQKPYHGLNLLLLQWNGQYASYKQITDAGGKVKKGSTATPIIFWKPFEVEEPDKDEPQIKFCLRYYSVFEIGIDTEGIDRREISPVLPVSGNELIHPYLASGPAIAHGYASASYDPKKDVIRLPHIKQFHSPDHYLKTLFHEIIHSTGHSSRLQRPLDSHSANRKSYAKEELTAEIGSAFLCNFAGIDSEKIFKQNTSYIQSWLAVLEDNPRMLISAASLAQKSVEYILNYSHSITTEPITQVA